MQAATRGGTLWAVYMIVGLDLGDVVEIEVKRVGVLRNTLLQ